MLRNQVDEKQDMVVTNGSCCKLNHFLRFAVECVIMIIGHTPSMSVASCHEQNTTIGLSLLHYS